jgi:hypothetical protein
MTHSLRRQAAQFTEFLHKQLRLNEEQRRLLLQTQDTFTKLMRDMTRHVQQLEDHAEDTEAD